MTDEIVTEVARAMAAVDRGDGYEVLARAAITAMRSAAQERALNDNADDALTDAQVERIAFFVERSPTHPPASRRTAVSRKLVRQIIEAYRLQSKAPETGEG